MFYWDGPIFILIVGYGKVKGLPMLVSRDAKGEHLGVLKLEAGIKQNAVDALFESNKKNKCLSNGMFLKKSMLYVATHL